MGPCTAVAAAHPEWFWPRNLSAGVYGQLCWTAPGLVDELIARVRGFLRAAPAASIISVSQNDANTVRWRPFFRLVCKIANR